MDDVTFGQLMTRGQQHTTIAWAQLAHTPPSRQQGALQVLMAFNELAHALTSLAVYLMGPGGTRAVLRQDSADPQMLAAARFTHALTTAMPGRPDQPDAITTGSPADHLKTAAITLRAATDLLATHRDADGSWRTPQSSALDDPAVRLSVLDRVAALVIELASVRPVFEGRPYNNESIRYWMKDHRPPDLETVREAAHHFRALLPLQSMATVMSTATVATPNVRLGQPIRELQDRLTRLRLTAWRAATYPTRETGITMLIDLATTAVMIHGRAAIVEARLAEVMVRDPDTSTTVTALLRRADAWRTVRQHLLTLHTAPIPEHALAEDIAPLRRLLEALTIAEAPANDPASREATPPAQLSGVLTTAAQEFEGIAESSITIMHNLCATALLRPLDRPSATRATAGCLDRAAAKLTQAALFREHESLPS